MGYVGRNFNLKDLKATRKCWRVLFQTESLSHVSLCVVTLILLAPLLRGNRADTRLVNVILVQILTLPHVKRVLHHFRMVNPLHDVELRVWRVTSAVLFCLFSALHGAFAMQNGSLEYGGRRRELNTKHQSINVFFSVCWSGAGSALGRARWGGIHGDRVGSNTDLSRSVPL